MSVSREEIKRIRKATIGGQDVMTWHNLCQSHEEMRGMIEKLVEIFEKPEGVSSDDLETFKRARRLLR